jgi:hypothetical protein
MGSARLHEHVRPGGAERADHDRCGSRKSCRTFTCKLIRKDHHDPRNAEQHAADLRPRHPFVRKIVMREQETEHGNDRLQNRSKAGGCTTLAPKEQAVVEREGKNSRREKQQPLLTSGGQRKLANADDDEQNDRRDKEPNAGKADRRKVFEAELDEEPCRSPNKTKGYPDDGLSIHQLNNKNCEHSFAERSYAAKNGGGKGMFQTKGSRTFV